MSHESYLRELLRPLGVYDMEGRWHSGELAAQGKALDSVDAELERIAREMLLTTAEDAGLEAVEQLLARRPVAETVQRRRAALAALLRIGGDSFTAGALNDTLAGCGLNAQVTETGEPGTVEVCFPEVPGIPDGFERMRKIIEDILPCHLLIRYVYWYITWAQMERWYPTWGVLEGKQFTWGELEKAVYPPEEEGEKDD